MMNEKNKMECNDLLKIHEMTQKCLDASAADAAMLATLVQMTRDGKDEMVMYMLHKLNPPCHRNRRERQGKGQVGNQHWRAA